MKKTALLLGATGLIGSNCLNYLLADDSYKLVKVITRRSLNRTHPKLKEYIIDFNQLEKSNVVFSCEDVFCCLGTTIKKAGSKENFRLVDFEYTLQTASLALAAGAKQYLLVSSIGSDKNSRNFYLRVKGEVEDAISKLNFNSFLIFRPSLLLGARSEIRLAEKISGAAAKIFSPLFLGGLKKYKPIEAKDVAKAMVILANQNQTGIKIIISDEIKKKADE
jgi:uncharacterized protein YbjT (DUF2867 family)